MLLALMNTYRDGGVKTEIESIQLVAEWPRNSNAIDFFSPFKKLCHRIDDCCEILQLHFIASFFTQS